MRGGPDAKSPSSGNDVAMDWSHMTNWGWAMMALWTTLWIVLVAVVVVVGTRWAKLH